MDEMKINLNSNFMRSIVAKILSKVIFSKTGCKVNIKLNKLTASVVDGETYISTGIEARLDSDEFTKLMKSLNLDT